MNLLDTLTGMGRVTIGPDAFDEIAYCIEVSGPRQLNRARGSIHADRQILAKLFRAANAVLELKDGRLVPFFVTGWGVGQDYASITARAGVSGVQQMA